MINAIRLVRIPPPIVLRTPLPPHLKRIISPALLRSRQSIGFATAADQNPQNMDDSQNTAKETGDIMSHSFGEGYATRSEEEGFGGTYGGNNQSASEDNTDDKKSVIHQNHPEYDKSQGSEVKEKEKSRHQTHTSS